MPSTKETNPKDNVGIRKAPLHHIPCGVLFELGLAMLEGACKYGSHNYREAGVRASVYYDAFERHVMAWWEGEDIDADSGLPHLIKAIACLVVLRDGILMGNWVDDRPIQSPTGLDTNRLNKQAAELIDRFPTPKVPFTQVQVVSKEPFTCGNCAEMLPGGYCEGGDPDFPILACFKPKGEGADND